MKRLHSWIESDVESPSPGELVAMAIYQPSDCTIRVLLGASLYLSENWKTYELLGPSGEIYQVNVTSDTMPRVFICRYGNAAKAFSLDFQKRSVLWSPV